MNQEVVVTENDLPAEVMRAVKQGQKVVAIKLLRESTGIGLANAKVVIDRAAAKHAPRPPRQAVMRDYNPINTRLISMGLLLVAVFVAYKLFVAP